MTDQTNKSSRRDLAWPIGIAAFLVFFVLILIVAIIASSMQNRDLVEDQYYGKGLKHEEQMERSKRAMSDSTRVQVDYNETIGDLTLTFPDNDISGTVTLYRPSHAALDQSEGIRLDENREFHVTTDGLPGGLWRLKVLWKENDLEYYHEESLVLKDRRKKRKR